MAELVNRKNRHGLKLFVGLIGFLLFSQTLLCDARALAAEEREMPNVLLMTVDSFRPDLLHCYGFDKPISPNIDRLAREGVLFTQTIGQSAWTSPGMVSILTSLYPPVHGVDGPGKTVPAAALTAVDILGQNGFTCPELSYLFVNMNYANLGFQPLEPGFSRGRTKDEIITWIEGHKDERFFLWYHFHKTHLPYNPPSPYRELFPPRSRALTGEALQRIRLVETEGKIFKEELRFEPEDRDHIVSLYCGEVRQQDDEIGDVLERLRTLGLLDRTIVILSADHGEELLEHGHVGHASTSRAGTLYDELIRLPLIIRYPPIIPKGKIVRDQVQAVDIMPTIFEMLDIAVPPVFQGRSLLPLIQDEQELPDRYAFSETTHCGYQVREGEQIIRLRSIRTERWKLIGHFAVSETDYELYDLRNDPAERNNLVSGETEVFERLRRVLEEWQLECERTRTELERQSTAGSTTRFDDTGSGYRRPEGTPLTPELR